MLVLTRKPGEKIHIGDGIVLTVLEVKGARIRLGIEAPEDQHIVRGELNSAGQASSLPLGKTARLEARPMVPLERETLF